MGEDERDYDGEIDDIWPQVCEAFARYGRRLRGTPGPSRRELAKKRLKDGYGPEDLVRAIHGYVHFHDGLSPKGDFNPMKWFDPDSVWKATRFETRVELGEEPWEYVDPKTQHERRVRARQEAAQRRLEEARALAQRSKFRAVEGGSGGRF